MNSRTTRAARCRTRGRARWVAHVRLFTLKATRGFGGRGPCSQVVTRFARWLEEAGLRVTVRESPGSKIAAACGQLSG